MTYATIISAHPRVGWALAYRDGACIVHHRLDARDLEQARVEAQRIVGPGMTVVIPRLGEEIPDEQDRKEQP